MIFTWLIAVETSLSIELVAVLKLGKSLIHKTKTMTKNFAEKFNYLEAVLISYNDNYIVCHFDAICISFRHLFLVSLLE